MIPFPLGLWVKPAVAGGYVPYDPVLWFDASDTSTLTLSGSNVTGWRCKASGVTWSQATSANQPTKVSSGSFNHDVIAFDNDGNNKYITGSTIALTRPYSAFMLLEWDNSSIYQSLCIQEGTANNAVQSGAWENMFVYSTISGSVNRALQMFGSATQYAYTTGGTIVAPNPTVYTMIVPDDTPANVTLRVQGAAAGDPYPKATSGSSFTTTFDAQTMGSTDNNYISNGRMAEAIVYPVALSTAEQNAVISALMSKWVP